MLIVLFELLPNWPGFQFVCFGGFYLKRLRPEILQNKIKNSDSFFIMKT